MPIELALWLGHLNKLKAIRDLHRRWRAWEWWGSGESWIGPQGNHPIEVGIAFLSKGGLIKENPRCFSNLKHSQDPQ
jgi:hypothetical protein